MPLSTPTSRPVGAFVRAQRLALVSVACNLGLAGLGIWIGWVGNSTTVLAAGVEFAADVVASLVVLAGFWFASRPADLNHPYGHGRAETLTGLLVGLGLCLVGLAIATRSLQYLGHPSPVPERYTVYPLAIALLVKSVLMAAKWRTGRRIGSQALLADAWNDSVDVLSAGAALAALGLALYDPARFALADDFGGFVVGLFVIAAGLGVVRATSLDLIDTMPPDRVVDDARMAALAVDGVRGVEKCYGRRTGLQYHLDLHLEVDGWITVEAGHDLAARVRDRIRHDVATVSDVLVHVEPAPEVPRDTVESRPSTGTERGASDERP
jgi:cation diffusion facilitator family transporter